MLRGAANHGAGLNSPSCPEVVSSRGLPKPKMVPPPRHDYEFFSNAAASCPDVVSVK